MPYYSYLCSNKRCKHSKVPVEIFSTISNYRKENICPNCGLVTLIRDYRSDLPNGSVKKGDDEITVGHLAHRNTERMSDDQKEALWIKNHEYMEKPLSYHDHKKSIETKKLRKQMQEKFGINKTKKEKNVKNNKKRTK